jgi:hypothetical protein
MPHILLWGYVKSYVYGITWQGANLDEFKYWTIAAAEAGTPEILRCVWAESAVG